MNNDPDSLLPDVPREGAVLDLDALEAERREGRGTALEVKWRSEVYVLPIEMPMEAVEELATMATAPDIPDDATNEQMAAAMAHINKGLDGGLAILFCSCTVLPVTDLEGKPLDVRKAANHETPCQWARFLATRPSIETRMSLVRGVWAAYGVSLGEALAPLTQSASTTAPSEQTSNGSTAATPATSGRGKAPADRQRKTPAKRAPARKRATAPRSGSATS